MIRHVLYYDGLRTLLVSVFINKPLIMIHVGFISTVLGLGPKNKVLSTRQKMSLKEITVINT